ncbi:hypothetical protein [Aurantiacibacter rhizosphaerae]|uniref:Class I SAM-dependent methyltransferase n=1 Tax=Aurantiacibacter rhizosphaerae TaxID=2691582 RepID=A0A844XBU8_9SPHN|nr:hypothetical protein [Aurantiacibacter rhizosphaerae]MWV26985.1 hypothetical protein [Aurantiacibacter rhizosphaerae]
MGVEGPWFDKDKLVIKNDEFIQLDFNQSLAMPKERFDIVGSLEGAEHMSEDCAQGFVNALCDLSDVVVFAAAIPLQRGYRAHQRTLAILSGRRVLRSRISRIRFHSPQTVVRQRHTALVSPEYGPIYS